MLKLQIKHKIVGKSLVAIFHDGKKLTFTGEQKEKDKGLKLIEDYNKRNSKEKLDKIKAFFTAKIEKKKIAKKIEVKKAKRQIKEVKQEVKRLKRKSVGDSGAGNLVPMNHPLKKDKRFTLKEGEVYLAPYESIPMPTKLVEKIIICVNSNVDLTPYINFWKLALLNPNPIARTKMFDYLEKHNLIVTPYGYIVTFRMVKRTDKRTSNNTPIFTSAHTRAEDYIIGTAFSIPREQCDEEGKNDCSRGLHTGSPAFIGIQVGDGYGKKIVTTKVASPDSYGTGYDNPKLETKEFDQAFGNQAVICLVNPMHVVSIPFSDTRKMRSCELFFCKLTTAEEVIDLTEKDYLLFDHDYHNYELAELEKMLKSTKLINYKDTSKEKENKAALAKKEVELKALKDKVNYNKDRINAQLGIGDLKRIIQSRIKLV